MAAAVDQALGQRVVGLVPEEAVHLGLPGQLQADAVEIVPEGLGIEACRIQLFAGVRGDLAVLRVILQEQRDLLAAEVLADAPGIRQNAQAHFMRLFHDGVDIGEPEVHIKFSDGEDHGIAAVLQHLLKIPLRVLDVIEAVVADASMFDCHIFSP